MHGKSRSARKMLILQGYGLQVREFPARDVGAERHHRASSAALLGLYWIRRRAVVMRTRIMTKLASIARRRPSVQTTVPAWALEDTQEVEALRRINGETAWATESTGLLSALSVGLSSMDRHGATGQVEGSGAADGGTGWVCRSGEVVEVGDVVALCHGASSDLVARIAGGTTEKLRCTVVSGSGFIAGDRVSATFDQLLVKVLSRPVPPHLRQVDRRRIRPPDVLDLSRASTGDEQPPPTGWDLRRGLFPLANRNQLR